MTDGTTPTDPYSERIGRLADGIRASGADAVIVGPGSDQRYLLGYTNASFERLTCLVVPRDGTPTLVVPALERPGWDGTAVERLDIRIATWRDGEDATELVASAAADARRLLVDEHLPALHALTIGRNLPGSSVELAGPVLSLPRMRKSPDELAALDAAAAAIDRVQQRIGEWLGPGRTEEQVAEDIAAAIIAEGHERADFVIVGSGPNGASPHHDASGRVIQPGDAVVIDIGGPEPGGYNSDCTRTYLVPGVPDPQYDEVYEVVRAAQEAGVRAVRPGATAESVDAAAFEVIRDAGWADHVLSRTGHGIGLDVHEEPYIVRGNTTALEPGMTFSVEPGVYLPGRFGVRIEDIVVVTDAGVRRLNEAPRELLVVG